MDLTNRTVLITGGARRIGRELALAAGENGFNVIIHHGHSSQDAEATAAEIEASGSRAWILAADLADPEQAAKLIDRAFEIQPIYALVNSAAIFEPLSLKETTLENWQQTLNLNLTAPFLLSQAFGNKLAENQEGRIVNILDWRALRPGKDHFPYTITKAALADMTRALAVALAPNISVNGLALGAILPPSTGSSGDILKNVPAGRWARLEELHKAFIFLLQGPLYLTGEIIHLDGGRHLI